IQLSANRNSDYSIEKIEQGLKELQEMLTKNGLPKSWKPWKEEKEKEDGDGILIAVTKNLIDGGIFHKAGVWCGLANNVADPKEQKESTNEIHKESNPTCTENPKKPTKTNPNAIPILILILVVITVAIGLIWMRPQEPEEQPQILPIPQELIAPNGGKQTLIRPTKEINSKTFLSY
ncbi:MAG: hypothetical protein SAJ12_22955, partial [Jaaginema sp. PMC 1079.18]|nr:hypothetical protein [Jaaginema sp. PMC 1079.18]